MSKKIVSLLLVLVMLVGCFAGCFNRNKPSENPDNNQGNTENEDKLVIKEGDYTYKSWSSALGTNWNPHTWEMNADNAIMGYIESPLVDLAPLNTEEGTYQWVYEMATSITDVTAANQADLTKYGVTLPEGKTPADITDSYVYEIKLNPNAKWQNGDLINADTYVYSMQMLLSSKMRNYRANNYISGSSALAGAMGYYNSEAPMYAPIINYNGNERVPVELPENTDIYLSLVSEEMTMASYSFQFMLDYYVDEELYNSLKEQANGYGYIKVTEENYADIVTICDQYLWAFNMDLWMYDFFEAEDGEYVWSEEDGDYVPVEEGQTGTHNYEQVLVDGQPVVNEEYLEEFFFYISGYGEKVEWDAVGLYKVDDYTIRYVCNTAYEYNYFLTSCTSNWIVHKATYEANMKEEGGLLVTTYGTSKDTTVSYGPYKISNFEDDKQVVFVQNDNWYGYEKTESGYLYSVTPFEVDGKNIQQYQTTKLVIDVMTQADAYSRFLAGELTDYAPTADELIDYNLSDRLFRVDETYTMRWFFNCAETTLKTLDTQANTNSIVLSNYNFRKAMSLAINRADFVTVTEGWKPAYSLMNQLYYYDVYNDPTSSYRNSDVAMQAICNLYGVKYGEGTIYPTLADAYKSITGYNLTEAKALMAEACAELVAAGLYTAGEPIKIQIAWKASPLEDADNAQLAKLNQYLNAAMEGSGFGTIEFEAIGSLSKRYDDVIAGKYAIGWGAWGGAAFYPFGMMKCYMDPDYGKVHESGSWSPKTEELTLTFVDSKGETVTDTLTWQLWSQSLEGTGKYANEDNTVKLAILAQLEEKYLNLYYCIPMAGTTVCSLLSYQVEEYTQDYNVMYAFGGFRLMSWNYTDAEWTAYVAAQGGTLNYK